MPSPPICLSSWDCWPSERCWLLRDGGGQVVLGLRRRVRQGRGVVVVFEVGAGLTLPVLPEVFLPARDGEQLDEQARVLAVSVQGPVGGPGPEPRPAQPAHGLQERLLL